MKVGPPHPRRIAAGRTTRATAAAGAALLASLSIVALTTGQASAAAGCSINYTISSQWNVGFSTNVTITDLGSPLTSWTLGWTFGGNQQITQLWNGGYTQSGAAVTVTNLSYNGTIATNGTTAFGFNGSYSGANAVPSNKQSLCGPRSRPSNTAFNSPALCCASPPARSVDLQGPKP